MENSNSYPKLIFASFQGFKNDRPYGMAKFLIPLISRVENDDYKYYVGEFDKSSLGNNIEHVSLKYDFYRKLVRKFISLSGSTRLKSKSRRWLEIIFDYYLSKRIKNACTLVTTAYLVKTTIKNNKLGGTNIFISGNPDDQAIFNILEHDRKRYGIDINDPYTDKKRLKRINDSLKLIDKTFVFTQSQFDTYSASVPPEKLFYIASFIQPDYTSFPQLSVKKNLEFTFCYIAHTVWLKGLTYLLEAWTQAELKNSKLIIGGSIEPTLNRYIRKNFPKLENVEFVGHVGDLNYFFRSSHVTVVPSLLDAGPATVAESLYCGTPVICSDACGSKALINEQNGIIFKARSVEDLLETLLLAKSKFFTPIFKNLIPSNDLGNMDNFYLEVYKFVMNN